MRRILLWILVACVVAAPGCGGGGRNLTPRIAPTASGTVETAPPEEGTPQRNSLTVVTPPLSSLTPGAEFDFILRGAFCEELYQSSGRILYDPAVVEPVRVSRGALMPSGFVFMAKLDEPGLVPYAFTALPGDSGIAPGRGELLRVRFRLLAEPPRGFRLRLLNDAAYLQLRDSRGGRLSFDLASEVVPQ